MAVFRLAEEAEFHTARFLVWQKGAEPSKKARIYLLLEAE
jgi:hypothetical protein